MNLMPLKTDVPLTDHTIASHIDTDATGAQLNILVGQDNATRTFLGLGSGDNVTFAGLTLTGLSGLVRASAGILSAGGMYDSDYGVLLIPD